MATTLKQGTDFTDTAGRTGIVQYDPNTGSKLSTGQVVNYNPSVNNGFVPPPNLNVQPIAPVNINASPIPVDNLNAQPLNLQTPPPPTSAIGGQAYIASTSQGLQNSLQGQIDSLQKNNDAGLQGVESIYQKLLGQSNANEKIYKDLGVDNLKRKTDSYANQIEAEQVATRHKVEALQRNNPDGILRGAMVSNVDQINRDSLSKQADLGVLQAASAREYDTAANIAQRKIESETENLKTALDATKYYYEQNKGDLNKKQDQLFQLKIQQDQRQYEETVANKTASQKAIIEAAQLGAPEDLLKQAQTLYNQGADTQQVQSMLGQYSKTATDRADQLFGQNIQTQQLGISRANLGIAQGNLRLAQAKFAADNPPPSPFQSAQAVGSIQQTSDLANSKALAGAVGTTAFGRLTLTGQITGARQNFLAGVDQLRNQLTLNALQNAKKNGATFGALSEGELNLLQSSASKINSWAVTDNGKPDGKVIGYQANESDFKAELDKINNFAKLDALIKGADPTQLGVQVHPDGTYWTLNSNGTVTQLQ